MSPPGFWELMALGVLALLIFGPDKLPGIARTVGQTVSQFRREARSTLNELRQAADLRELEDTRRELAGAAKDVTAAADEVERAAELEDRPREQRARSGRTRAQSARRRLSGPPAFDPDAT